MADTDQVGLYYVAEQVRGVIPTNPILRALRFTGGGPTQTPRSVETKEIRPDRQTSDRTLVAIDAAGDTNVEWSYGNLDAFLEAGMAGTWANAPATAPTAMATGTITTGAGQAAQFRKGSLLRGAGFGVAGNNALFVVTSDGAGTAVAVSGGASEPSPAVGARVLRVGFQAAAGDLAAVADGITISATSGSFIDQGIARGDWVKIGSADQGAAFNFDAAALNDWARVINVTATKLTFDILPPGWTANAGTGKTIRLWLGERLDHGTTRRSFTVQRRFNDIGVFENFTGMQINTVRVEGRPQDLLNGSVSFIGQSGAVSYSNIPGAIDVDAPTGDVMSTGADVARMAMGGQAVGVLDENYVQSVNFTIDNQMAQRAAVGKFGSIGTRLGRLKIEGTLETYFATLSLYQAALANQDTSFDMRVQDNDGHAIIFDLPRIKTEGTPTVPGSNQDVILPLRFSALKHPVLGYMMRIMRFAEWH